MAWIQLVTTALILLAPVNQGLNLPRTNLPWDTYYKPGDIMLGGIFPLHKYAPDKWCSDRLLGTLQTQFVEAMVFAVKRINQNRDKLHNLTLGFIIYDDCAREMVALARALSFVGGPRNTFNNDQALVPMTTEPITVQTTLNFSRTSNENDDKNSVNVTKQNGGSQNNTDDLDLPTTLTDTPSTIKVPYHKVIGVVGPMRSLNTILSAELFTLFKMPQISAVSTADDLSNKAKYPYFLRMVPPDQNQAEAIVSLLQHFRWTYFSAIYSQGTYGLGGMNRVRHLASSAGMCVAYLKEIDPKARTADFDDVIRKLRKHSNAKAVVVFANAQEANGVIEAAKRAKTHGEFIWIFSDGLSSLSSLGENKDVVEGAFMVQLASQVTPEFDGYFQSLNPYNNKDNPWFGKFWERNFHCSLEENGNSGDQPLCTGDERISADSGYKQDGRVSLFIDTLQTYALGINKLIETECTEYIRDNYDQEKLISCIHEGDLIQYLKTLIFYGQIGKIEFDSNGDMLGLYAVKQVVKNQENFGYDLSDIGGWSAEGGLIIDDERVQWTTFGGNEVQFDMTDFSETTSVGNVPGTNLDDAEDPMVNPYVPISVCSHPCGPGELVFIQEVSCCWECHKCRPNEITHMDLKKCSPCQLGYWPSADRMNCLPIDETYLSLPSFYAIIIVVITVASVCMEGGVIATFILNRSDKLIKATSRELSICIFFGLSLGLVTVFALVTRPNYPTCVFARVAFHVSVTICYAALLVRTNRIYRIFEAGRKTTRRPPLIGTTSQIVFTLILIVVQVVIISVTTVLYPPKPTLAMPIVDTRYVELSCDLPVMGLVIPLSYNLLLIALSTFFGFKIRRLPENFNESKCIFVCACTTLFVFSAFLPTYFVALYSHYKSMLLCLCLVLNADVILLMLFMPRVYALYWVDDQSIVYGDTKGPGTTASKRAVHLRSTQQSHASSLNVPKQEENQVIQPHSKGKTSVLKKSSGKVAPSIEVVSNQE